MILWSYTTYLLLVWFSTRLWGLRVPSSSLHAKLLQLCQTLPSSSKNLINNCWMNEWTSASRKEHDSQKQKWRCEWCCQAGNIYIHHVSKAVSGLIPTEQRVGLRPWLWHERTALLWCHRSYHNLTQVSLVRFTASTTLRGSSPWGRGPLLPWARVCRSLCAGTLAVSFDVLFRRNMIPPCDTPPDETPGASARGSRGAS